MNSSEIIKTINDRRKYIIILLLGIIFIIVFLIFQFIFSKANLDSRNCKSIKDTYSDFPLLSSLTVNNNKFGIRDYYIKSAYNCCSTGKFKNDYVNICGLTNCIKQGARFLDFEIYSIDDEPIIAVSSQNQFSFKESYNGIKFIDAMETINMQAFNNSYCPNYSDPLILHFRIKSKNKEIYKKMSHSIHNTIHNRTLGKKYSYEYFGNNITKVPIQRFFNKIIIIVDKSNNDFEDTPLNEYVNITSNSMFCRLYRYNDIKNMYDPYELMEYNKKNISIILPDMGYSNSNNNILLSNTYGCQFHCMNFQNFDSNMSFNTTFFDESSSAFILKEDELRYKPIVLAAIKPPKKPDLNLKHVKSNIISNSAAASSASKTKGSFPGWFNMLDKRIGIIEKENIGQDSLIGSLKTRILTGNKSIQDILAARKLEQEAQLELLRRKIKKKKNK